MFFHAINLTFLGYNVKTELKEMEKFQLTCLFARSLRKSDVQLFVMFSKKQRLQFNKQFSGN